MEAMGREIGENIPGRAGREMEKRRNLRWDFCGIQGWACVHMT